MSPALRAILTEAWPLCARFRMLKASEQIEALLAGDLSSAAAHDVVFVAYECAHALETYLAMRCDAQSVEDSIASTQLVTVLYAALGHAQEESDIRPIRRMGEQTG